MTETIKPTVEQRLAVLERAVAELQLIVGDLKDAIEQRVDNP